MRARRLLECFQRKGRQERNSNTSAFRNVPGKNELCSNSLQGISGNRGIAFIENATPARAQSDSWGLRIIGCKLGMFAAVPNADADFWSIKTNVFRPIAGELDGSNSSQDAGECERLLYDSKIS